MSATTTPPAAAPTAPPAGVSAPPAPASAPAGEAPPSEMPAWAKALQKQVEEMSAERTQMAEAKEAATKQATQATAEKVTLAEQFAKLSETWKADKGNSALADAARQIQYASPLHAENALQVFKGAHRIEVRDSGDVVAIGKDGKAQPVGSAFNAWAAGPSGSLYRASPTQPGAGAPQPLVPDGGTPKMPLEMSPSEFAAFKAQGIQGRLHPSGPMMGVKTVVNPFAAAADRLLGMANGTSRQTK